MPTYTDSVPRSLNDKLGECVSVLDFNVTGDGTTDDTANLQKALDNCRGQLYVNPGEYKITGPLYVPSNTLVFGAGPSLAIFKGSGSGRPAIWVRNASNVTLEGFTFDGGSKPRAGIRIGTTDAATEDMQEIRLHRLYIKNSGNMTAPSDDSDATFGHNIEIKKGITLVDTAYSIRKVWITECVCENAAGDGIYGGDNLSIASYDVDGTGTVTDVYVDRCHFSKTGRQNISVEGIGTTRPDSVFLSNLTLADSSLGGIDVEDGNKVTLNNIVFLRSGAYEGYARKSNIPADSEMRAGLVLHGVEKELVCSNLIFQDCHYGISGYLTVKISDSKFINSYIANGTASTAGPWEFVNCEFKSNTSDPLMKLSAPTASFIGCRFSYTGSASHMIWLQSDTTYFSEILFDACVFLGNASLDAISLQAVRSVLITGCAFRNFRKVVTTTSIFGAIVLSMQGNHIRTVAGLILDCGYLNGQDVIFSGNYCDEVAGGLSFSTAKRVHIENNNFQVKMQASDGLSHDLIYANPVEQLLITGNTFRLTGNATDARVLNSLSKNDDVTPAGPIFAMNRVIGFAKGVRLKQYDSGYQYRGAKVIANDFTSVTSPIEDISGCHVNTYEQHGNTAGDNTLNGTGSFVQNDNFVRFAKADGTQFPAAGRIGANTDDDFIVDATAGKLKLQVGASNKVTVDSSGRMAVNTDTVGGQLRVFVVDKDTPGMYIRGATNQAAVLLELQKADGTPMFLVEASGNVRAAGSFAAGMSTARYLAGTGDPEGSVTADVGSLYLRTDTNGVVYVKYSGGGNTGWRQLTSTTSGTLPLSQGGTGATTASGALSNLGAAAAAHTHGGQTISPDHLQVPNTGTLKVASATGSFAPAAVRVYSDASNIAYFDATAGSSIRLQVGGATKLTLDNAGNLSITGAMSFGSALPIASGGTGQTTAANALAALGGAPSNHVHSNFSGTVTLAKLTETGHTGGLSFINGVVTSITPAT